MIRVPCCGVAKVLKTTVVPIQILMIFVIVMCWDSPVHSLLVAVKDTGTSTTDKDGPVLTFQLR